MKYYIHNDKQKQVPIAAIMATKIDRPYVVTIEQKKAKKTNEQNALYWMWITIIGDEFGNFKKDQSEWLKEELLEPKIVTVNGKSKEVYSSIADMSVPELSEYLNKVSTWAGSQGINLPHPEDLQRNYNVTPLAEKE